MKVSGADAVYWFCHSGPRDCSGLHDVAIAPSQKVNGALILLVAKIHQTNCGAFQRLPRNLMEIAVYAPTNAAGRTTKNAFYEFD